MGNSFMKKEYDDEKVFLGGLTEKQFYDSLHFNRQNMHSGRWGK